MNAIAAPAVATDREKTKGALMFLRLLAGLSFAAFLIFANAGGCLDPYGCSAAAVDKGMGLDPNGATSDAGAGIDPEGSRVSSDGGPHMDPNG